MHPQFSGVVDTVSSYDLKMKLSSERAVNSACSDLSYCAMTKSNANGVRNPKYGTISAGTGVVGFFEKSISARCRRSMRIDEIELRKSTKNRSKHACCKHTLLILASILSSGLFVLSPNVRCSAFRPSTHS